MITDYNKDNIQWKLNSFNIIIGPNNCGKSRILQEIHKVYYHDVTYIPYRDVVKSDLPISKNLFNSVVFDKLYNKVKSVVESIISTGKVDWAFIDKNISNGDDLIYYCLDTNITSKTIRNLMLIIFYTIVVNDDSTIIIEHPDTELHPSTQSRLIEYLVKVSNERNIQIILDTHSYFIIKKAFIWAQQNKQSINSSVSCIG